MFKNKMELREMIRDGIENIVNSGMLQDYLSFLAKLRNYSFVNTLLIYQHNPYATHVAGMRKWNELGRFVRKGEKAIMIFAPRFRKNKSKEIDEETGLEVDVQQERLSGFVSVPVFDISQTDGDKVPSLVNDFGGHTELFERFMSVFGRTYSISQQKLTAPLGGYTDGCAIVLNEVKSEEQKLKTLIHEVAHCVLNHVGNEEKLKSVKEIEAEMTAFIVAEHFGIDSGEYSFGYLFGWGKGDIDQIMESVDVAYKVSKEIIESVELEASKDLIAS
ncbi:MAG: ArdC-like ssDNA-binding domain-containing protein [Deferribacterales bacterium]